MQQIFTRHQRNQGRLVSFEYNYIPLEGRLLRPEHFTAGFLLWLSTLEPPSNVWFDDHTPFLAFSSAPASLTPDLLVTAKVTPILCENFALLPCHSTCWPRARDLVPAPWTVLVSQELIPGLSNIDARRIRYAFARVRGQSIVVEDSQTYPGPDELEVIDLKEFLAITAPEVDPSIIGVCLENMSKAIATLQPRGKPWPSEIEPLSVLGRAEGADMLLEFLNEARSLNEKYRRAMEEDPESKFKFTPSF